MKTLETVYLMNVVLYVDSIHTLLLFIQTSHKCKEAVERMKKNPPISGNIVSLRTLFKIFIGMQQLEYDYITLSSQITKEIASHFESFETTNKKELTPIEKMNPLLIPKLKNVAISKATDLSKFRRLEHIHLYFDDIKQPIEMLKSMATLPYLKKVIVECSIRNKMKPIYYQFREYVPTRISVVFDQSKMKHVDGFNEFESIPSNWYVITPNIVSEASDNIIFVFNQVFTIENDLAKSLRTLKRYDNFNQLHIKIFEKCNVNNLSTLDLSFLLPTYELKISFPNEKFDEIVVNQSLQKLDIGGGLQKLDLSAHTQLVLLTIRNYIPLVTLPKSIITFCYEISEQQGEGKTTTCYLPKELTSFNIQTKYIKTILFSDSLERIFVDCCDNSFNVELQTTSRECPLSLKKMTLKDINVDQKTNQIPTLFPSLKTFLVDGSYHQPTPILDFTQTKLRELDLGFCGHEVHVKIPTTITLFQKQPSKNIQQKMDNFTVDNLKELISSARDAERLRRNKNKTKERSEDGAGDASKQNKREKANSRKGKTAKKFKKGKQTQKKDSSDE